MSLAGSVTHFKTPPEEQPATTGRPTIAGAAEMVQLTALLTVAERATRPPLFPTEPGETANCEIVVRGGFGDVVAIARPGAIKTPRRTVAPSVIAFLERPNFGAFQAEHEAR